MILALVLLLVPSYALTRLARPRAVSSFVAVFVLSYWSLVVVLVDTLGRLRFDAFTMILAMAALAAAGAAVLWRARHEPFTLRTSHTGCVSTPMWSTRVLLTLFVLVLAWSAFSVWVMPATVPDVVRYHLTQAVAWVRDGRVGVVPELDYRANYFPHAAQAPAALLYLLARTDRVLGVPQLVYSGVLFPVACFIALRTCAVPRRLSLFFALAASFAAPVILQMRVEMVDAAHSAALLIALVVAIDGRRHFKRPVLVLTLAAAMTLGTKSTGPLAAAMIALAAILGAWRTLGPRAVVSPKRWGAWSVAAVAAVLIGGWVFITNTLEHANPLYPFYFSLGPVHLAGPDATHAIYHYAWIHDFGESRLDRLAGGAARWVPMLLGIEPFNNLRGPGVVGPGYAVTAFTVVAALGIALAVFRNLIGTLIGRGATLALLSVLALYSVLFVMNVSLITAPWSTVDARYQLHLIVGVAIVAARGVHAAPRWFRTLAVWGVVAAAVPLSWTLVHDAPHRGLIVYKRMLKNDGDRSWIYERGPFFVSSDMDRLRSYIGNDETVLYMGRGHVYPIMWPSFERTVLPVTTLGADVRLVDQLGVPQDVFDRALKVLEDPGQRSKNWMGTRDDWEDYGDELARTPNPYARAYITALADTHGAQWVYVHRGFEGGEFPIMRDHPDWELVWFDQGPNARNPNDARTMALYRRVGPRSE